jgi:hypothetical protein
MADALVDFASLEDSAAAATTETTTTEQVEAPVEDSTVDNTSVTEDSTTTDGKETETQNADGSDKTPEEQAAFKAAAAAKVTSDKALEATPANVRTALKAMRDADPKNAGVVKELHGAFERWNAAKAVFPKGVAEMQEAKAFIESVGGPDGYQKMQDSISAVVATDELLYAADPKLWDNVIEDIKASGHPEALGALAPSFLEKLKAHDHDAYYNTTIPVVANAMKEVHMDSFVSQFNAALSEKDDKGATVPNIAKISNLVKSITDWYTDLDKDAKSRTATPTDTPERKKFLEEKAAFEKTKTEATKAERTKYEEGIAEDCDKHNNKSLGKVLGGYLRLPYFKDFPYETKVDLGNGIKDRLYSALKADKAYQTQMGAMWKQKNPDRAKMVQYHQAKVDSIATEIVKSTIQSRYPGYAKGGSAAGKAAAAVVKRDTATQAATQSVASGKPIYVAARPENLVREAIKVGSKDYSASDLVTLQIMGRGFVKTPDGKGFKFITWRK